MNMLYPFFGVSGPISPLPLIITISVVVLVLCVLSYARDKDFADPSFIDIKEVLSPPVLFLCLIPFLAVLGTYLVNFYHNNILLMLMIVVIAFVALLICFDKFIPKNLYPLAVFVIAISLIYHSTLISMYLNHVAISTEYYFSKLVINSSIWDYTIPHNCNAVLSIVMLAPIFCNTCALDLTWELKIIHPLLYSIVPLGLYSIFKKETNDKIAFLSTFFFLSLPFSHILPALGTRQTIAEIFFVLLIMLIINKKIISIKKSFLSVIFAISLIVSHYGLSYLVMFSLIFVLLFLFMTENQTIKRLWGWFYFKSIKDKRIMDVSNIKNKGISLTFVLLFITFTLAWYIYISGSSAFNVIINIGDQIANTIFIEFLSPESSRGMHSLAGIPLSPIRWVCKIINLSALFFICVGILKLSLKHREMKFEREYIGFSLYWFAICLAAIAVSYFAVMNPGRLYHLSLFLLAPLAVIGGITVFEVIIKILKISWTNNILKHPLRILKTPRKHRDITQKYIENGTERRVNQNTPLNIVYAFFIIFLLFNTGFIFEIAKDHPHSISLSQESIKKYGDINDKGTFMNLMYEQNVFSARWSSMNMEKDKMIYVTKGNGEGASALVAYGMILMQETDMLTNRTKEIREGNYIYLSHLNVVEGIGMGLNPKLGCPTYFNMTDVYPLLKDKDKIYTNGGSEVLWS
jgi:uncharacterized membrane protein